MKFLLILVLCATNAAACSVPVFRYALEHWAPDAYQVEVIHHAPLSEREQALIKLLTGAQTTNIALKQIEGGTGAPRLVVKHPASLPQPREVWSTTLTADSVQSLLDSPLRQEIATKLAEGDSAVWVLLESGDKSKDDAAAQLLERELQRLASTMELPALDDQDIKNGLVSVPDEGLRLSFPMLRLSREDPAEVFLIRSLLSAEEGLTDVREPMAFPIFGRGRVLYALVGKGIRADNLGHAAKFLIGSCSCQIKEQNPGIDLVMSADWKKLLKTDTLLDEELPKLSDIEGLKPILVPIPERAVTATTVDGGRSKLISAGAVIVLLAVASLIRRARNRKSQERPAE